MYFDVIFLDVTANKYYDAQTLEKHSLGGSEATVVRIAEGLARLGLSVCVLQSRCPAFEATTVKDAFYMHVDLMPQDIDCGHYIQIRRNMNPQLFPNAKRYLWLHDICSAKDEGFSTEALKGFTVVGVSKYHKKDIEEHLPGHPDVRYIYNPVHDNLYIPVDSRPDYDRNLIAWTASPHKGLEKALTLLTEMRKSNPKLRMAVFNPGYAQIDQITLSSHPGVINAGSMPCKTVWGILQKALCIFYPCPDWVETFGLIAAEANALGLPIATYYKGALRETVSSDLQSVQPGDEKGLMEKVLSWSEHGRPLVSGKDEFRYTEVIPEWVRLLARSTK